MAQLGNTGAGRVFCETALQGGDGRLLDVFRRVKVRLARAEATDIDPFRLHCFRFGVDREGEGGRELRGACGDFHGSIQSIQSRSGNYLRRQKFSINGLKLFSSTWTMRISRSAFSAESEAWAALIMIVCPNSLRMEPGGAFFGSVGPSTSRIFRTASSP